MLGSLSFASFLVEFALNCSSYAVGVHVLCILC